MTSLRQINSRVMLCVALGCVAPARAQPQIPGGCVSPPADANDSQAERDSKTRAFLLCLDEQSRVSRTIDDGLRRLNPPAAGTDRDPPERPLPSRPDDRPSSMRGSERR